MAKVSSPFIDVKPEKVHLKDEYYAQAKAQFISCIKMLNQHNIIVDSVLMEKLRVDIKSHYKAIEGF